MVDLKRSARGGAILVGGILLLALCLAAPPAATAKTKYKQLPVPGMVTLLEMGADWCGPCRRMAPILEEVEREYEGRAAVITLKVDEYRRLSAKLGVKAIPTLIFFDNQGRMVYRHQGFLAKKYIELVFEKLGLPKTKPQ